jgi:hypothetical protein
MTRYMDFTTGNNYLDEGIENYLMYGFEPGGFLSALLTNNLWLASCRADHWNSQNLAQIAKTVFLNMPQGSIGDEKIVINWMNDKDGIRSRYARIKEKEYTFKALKGEIYETVLSDPPF